MIQSRANDAERRAPARPVGNESCRAGARRFASRVLLGGILLLALFSLAQPPRPFPVQTARDRAQDGPPTPEWTNAPSFEKDVWTFARVKYASRPSNRFYGGGRYDTDAPDSDLNLSFRLQQMTAIKVDPRGREIELTDPALHDFPWLYMVEPGLLFFSEEEVLALRKYLLNGGFLMVDDFWGDEQWENFHQEIQRVLPGRAYEELDISHPIFHTVFDIKLTRQELQVPNVGDGTWHERTGITWERRWGPSAEEVHFRAFYDDKKRMMIFVAHNTDNGDGWEHEGTNPYFFREFAEKKSYPLGINVIFYAMTH